jgi:hypothetical protein
MRICFLFYFYDSYFTPLISREKKRSKVYTTNEWMYASERASDTYTLTRMNEDEGEKQSLFNF